MPWRTYSCYVCKGHRQIEVCRDFDGEEVKIEKCPICNGVGTINVPVHPYYQGNEAFWKRMSIDGGLV